MSTEWARESTRMGANEFHTISDADWRRSFAWFRSAEGQRNAVRDQIRTRLRALRSGAAGADTPEILDLKLGKSTNEIMKANP